MSDVWRDWIGQVADHKYQLQQFLGSTDHSVVFLAEFRDPEPRKVAIKFLAADSPNTEQQLAAWKAAAEVKHPSLITLYGSGRCKIADMDLLYVAMEYADENLAEVLPQRALTIDETRQALNTLVDALVFLHQRNLTHGHVKPSNVLAAGEQLKISSDTIQPAGEAREMNRKRSQYDAPEIPSSPYTPSADVWSLGVMLVEALTQQPAVLPFNEKADPVIPPSVPEPFFGIAEYALRRRPESRASSSQVAERLSPAKPAAKASPPESGRSAVGQPKSAETTTHPAEPKAAAAAAASVAAASPGPAPRENPSSQTATPRASLSPATPTSAAPMPMPAPATLAVSPLDVPLSKEPALPPDKRTRASAQYPPVPRQPVRSSSPEPKQPRQAITLPNYVVPLFAAVLVLVAIFVLPKILRHSTEAPSQAVKTASAPPPNTSAASPPSSSNEVATPSTTKPTAPENHLPPRSETPPRQSSPAAPPASTTTSPEFKTSPSAPGKGEVLDQVLPEVPGKALSTIQGTVRVVVRAHVNASGRVSEAVLDTPGPSRYFADKALAAARQWTFSSAVVDGHSDSSEWLIRFEFTREGVNAYPSQVQP
jgi:TonB family protein